MPAQLPQPLIDSDSREYWEGLARGELRIQRCDNCSRHVFYPRVLCPYCHSDQLTWVTATGRGTLYSYTVAHQAYGPFADETPFVVAIVELEEGVRMMTRIVGAPRERIVVGVAVHVIFQTVDQNITLPYFQLVEQNEDGNIILETDISNE